MIIYSGFTHWKWWFSIVMLNYQRVIQVCGGRNWAVLEIILKFIHKFIKFTLKKRWGSFFGSELHRNSYTDICRLYSYRTPKSTQNHWSFEPRKEDDVKELAMSWLTLDQGGKRDRGLSKLRTHQDFQDPPIICRRSCNRQPQHQHQVALCQRPKQHTTTNCQRKKTYASIILPPPLFEVCWG